MATITYGDMEYSVVYVDPSASTGGTGETPATALNALPTAIGSFTEGTAYIIRRTAETASTALPSGSSSTLKNVLLLGMPPTSDELYELTPSEAQTAWGADTAAYANVKMATSGGSFQCPNMQRFLLHRVYLFRDNLDATQYIFKFNYTSSPGIGCFAFEHCKFGALGIDVDDESSYKTVLASNRLKSYVYIQYARMLSIRDCIINHALTGNSSNPCGFYCYFADVLDVEDVQVYSPVWTDYTSNAYPLYLSRTAQKGVECQMRNVTQTIRMNGSSGTHVPTLFCVQGYVSCEIEDIDIVFGVPLSSTNPTSLTIEYPMCYLANVYEISLKDFHADLDYVRYAKEPVLELNRCYTGNYVPGVVKKLSGISIYLDSEDTGIGARCTYANAATSGDNYAALVVNFGSSDATMYAKVPKVFGVSVHSALGKAAYFEQVRLTDERFEGTVVLSAVEADIEYISSWFPGKILYASNGTHVRVRSMTANLDNTEYPYDEDPLVFSTYNQNGSVFVDEANASLAAMAASSSKASHIYQGIGCNNEGAEGRFAFRCANGLCDTWSVYRTGGGSAALKLTNNVCSGADTMVLGRRPFNGMQLTPTTTGRHVLKAHIAYKGFASDAELYRQFFISATINGRRYYSTVHGRWADDSASVWNNDSDLTQSVLEMPIDIGTVSVVDVRVYYSWYSAAGFVYLDPDITLETV